MCVSTMPHYNIEPPRMDLLNYSDLTTTYKDRTNKYRSHRSENERCISVQSPIYDKGYKVEYNSKVYNSASRVLEQYIKDHDHVETIGLTKSLTRGQSEHAVADLMSSRYPHKLNTPDKEIKLARKLFSEDYTKSLKEFDTRSMCTDDLLMESLSVSTNLHHDKHFELNSARTNTSSVKKCECGNTMAQESEYKPTHRTLPKSGAYSTFETDLNLYPPRKIEPKTPEANAKDYDVYSLNGEAYTPYNLKYSHLNAEKSSDMRPGGSFDKEKSVISSKYGVASKLNISYDKRQSPQKYHIQKLTSEKNYERPVSSPTPTDLLIENIVQDYRERKKDSDKDLSFQTTRNRSCYDFDEPQYNNSLSKTAGMTPFRAKNLPLDDSFNDNIADQLEVEEDQIQRAQGPLDHENDTKSHISVSLHLEGKASDVKCFMEDCLNDTIEKEPSPKTGAIESMKNMLFTLQNLRHQTEEKDNLDNQNFDSQNSKFDGHSSLQMAIDHLNRLSNI